MDEDKHTPREWPSGTGFTAEPPDDPPPMPPPPPVKDVPEDVLAALRVHFSTKGEASELAVRIARIEKFLNIPS